MHRLIPFPLLLLTALYATQAPAALVVSNLGHSRLFDVTVSDSLWHAVAFVSGADVTLDSADLLMGTSAGGGNFGVEIWSSNGRPDALLSSHPLYLAIGADDDARRAAYRELFRGALDAKPLSDLCSGVTNPDSASSPRSKVTTASAPFAAACSAIR